MEAKRNRTTKILIIIFAVALLIEVGYAILSSTLRINGNAKINRAGWDVHFENVQVTDGSVTAETEATIDEAKTTVNYVVTLAKPGDFYEFTVDAVNRGTIDAMISTIANTPLSAEQQKYLAYTVTYSDGTEIAANQLLASTKTETFKVRVEFKKNITAADLPTAETTLTLEFSANYVQADGAAIAVAHPKPVCKRATTLHTINSVEYGNLGTAGAELAAGDAFDCDVDGDGTYDTETERFYYVSDLDTNANYAVLLYYNTVVAGVPDNTAAIAYDSDNTPRVNGPKTAIEQLPTTAQWSKVSLSSTTRTIKDETGVIHKADFSYAGKAARLLTVNEVENACGKPLSGASEELVNCKYLMENTYYSSDTSTQYAYWLETVSSFGENYVWLVEAFYHSLLEYEAHNSGDGMFIGPAFYYDTISFGVRPAIEVPKTEIAY